MNTHLVPLLTQPTPFLQSCCAWWSTASSMHAQPRPTCTHARCTRQVPQRQVQACGRPAQLHTPACVTACCGRGAACDVLICTPRLGGGPKPSLGLLAHHCLLRARVHAALQVRHYSAAARESNGRAQVLQRQLNEAHDLARIKWVLQWGPPPCAAAPTWAASRAFLRASRALCAARARPAGTHARVRALQGL